MTFDFRQAIIALAHAKPHMKAATLVDLALALEAGIKPDMDDAARFGLWVRQQPTVAEHIAAGNKIHAIKEVRALTGASLLQAKNAVEAAGVR